MIRELLFCLVVLLSNAVQAATGFAGTMLAMAPSLKLLGPEAAKPLLAAFAFLVSAVLTVRARKHMDLPMLLRISLCMLAGLVLGMLVEKRFSFDRILPLYGAFLIGYALYRLIFRPSAKLVPLWAGGLIMVAAGMLQSMFLSGGALLVIYASAALPDKERFRATLSPVWVLLNGILLTKYVVDGLFTQEVLRLGAVGLVPLAAGILLGNLLHDKLSQGLFLKICFILLLLNGVWILMG